MPPLRQLIPERLIVEHGVVRGIEGPLGGASGGLILVEHAEIHPPPSARQKTLQQALASLGVDALISIGGDDTLKTANKFKMFQDQLPPEGRRIAVVHVPSALANRVISADITPSVTDAFVTEPMRRSYPVGLRHGSGVWRNRQEIRRSCLPPARITIPH